MKVYRIEVRRKKEMGDPRGRYVVKQCNEFLGEKKRVTSCWTQDVYYLEVAESWPGEVIDKVKDVFSDPIIASSSVGRFIPFPEASWVIEVGFKPGVTDNLAKTAVVLVEDTLGRRLVTGEGIYTATQYFVSGSGLNIGDVRWLASKVLANQLVNTVTVRTVLAWEGFKGAPAVPRIEGGSPVVVNTVKLGLSDEELIGLSKKFCLALNLAEMRAISSHYFDSKTKQVRRLYGLPEAPTDLELECLAQTWSEHCYHKIFKAKIIYEADGKKEVINSLFSSYIKGATAEIKKKCDWLVSVFTDNAGIIRFTDKLNVVYKVETHNTPSALDPYGGALTGIVGCNRDPMGTGLGAELLCNTWGYCLASPFHEAEMPAGLLHPRILRRGIHQGVIDGGNQSGVPYARGFEIFDERYIGKPLVYCGTVGIMPAVINGVASEKKEVFSGDLVVMVGGRIGKDGIHGATFSSEELRDDSPVQAVQIGDPITQRRLYDFLLEARNLGLYRAITDNGAGGLSSSVGEMACLSGGADIDLAKAPLKYGGLQPWEIFLSEAQERMTLAVAPEHLDKLLTLASRRDVNAAVLGEFNNSGYLVVRYQEKVAGLLDMHFLHSGCPSMELEASWVPPVVRGPTKQRVGSRNSVLLGLLGSLNLCSREYKSRMYDAEVKGRSVVKPLVGVFSDIPSDATIMLADYTQREGVVLAEGINPFYSDIDTYAMTQSVVDEAVRRIVSVGGSFDRIAGLDNFCWPDPVFSEKTPDGRYKLAQLVRSCKALYDITTAYNVPLISGKDSMKNDSTCGGRKISVRPTLLFSAIGKIFDISLSVTMPMKSAGDLIFLIGLTKSELGASAYHRFLAQKEGMPGNIGGRVPTVDCDLAASIYRAVNMATSLSLLRSSHTPTVGGLVVALAKSALGGDLGVAVDLGQVPVDGPLSDDEIMFSESNSRFLVTCDKNDAGRLKDVFRGLPIACLGKTNDSGRVLIRGCRGGDVVDLPLCQLRRVYKKKLAGID